MQKILNVVIFFQEAQMYNIGDNIGEMELTSLSRIARIEYKTYVMMMKNNREDRRKTACHRLVILKGINWTEIKKQIAVMLGIKQRFSVKEFEKAGGIRVFLKEKQIYPKP